MSKILVIPSIDIMDGKTVRVVQGIPEVNSTSYNNDPVDMAMIWRAENAKCIHVVDFNASQQGSKKNFEVVRKICESVIIPIEYGGGIRTLDDVKKLLDLGVYRVVIGTMAHKNPVDFNKALELFGSRRIIAAADVVDEKVFVSGRHKDTSKDVYETAEWFKECGVERIIVTDVKKNGMLSGPNIELSKNVAERSGLKVTLSGGVSGYEDLNKIFMSEINNLDSVIIGRALYENRFPCQKIWRVAECGIFN